MATFHGFVDSKLKTTPLPAQFFTELLPEVDHLGELKVTLYAFWRLDRSEGTFRCLEQGDFAADSRLLAGLADDPAQAGRLLAECLDRAVVRGTLLRAVAHQGESSRVYYFLNSPRGRAALQAMQEERWRPPSLTADPLTLDVERPNIYRLYEENIGPLTPMIAETLGEVETTYPASWIEEALQIAVERNVRRWNYVEAILRRWKEKGHDDQKQNRGNTEKDRRRYVEGEFSEFIER